MPKLKRFPLFFKGHILALWKDFIFGVPTIILLGLLYLIGETATGFIVKIGSLFTTNGWIQFILGLSIIIVIGIGSRNLKRLRWLKTYLPSEAVQKPEIMYKLPGESRYKLRILKSICVLEINGIKKKMIELAPAQGGPANLGGQRQGELIEADTVEMYLTGRDQGDVILSHITLGMRERGIILTKFSP